MQCGASVNVVSECKITNRIRDRYGPFLSALPVLRLLLVLERQLLIEEHMLLAIQKNVPHFVITSVFCGQSHLTGIMF